MTKMTLARLRRSLARLGLDTNGNRATLIVRLIESGEPKLRKLIRHHSGGIAVAGVNRSADDVRADLSLKSNAQIRSGLVRRGLDGRGNRTTLIERLVEHETANGVALDGIDGGGDDSDVDVVSDPEGEHAASASSLRAKLRGSEPEDSRQAPATSETGVSTSRPPRGVGKSRHEHRGKGTGYTRVAAPLHVAARNGHLRTVASLVRARASLEARMLNGASALSLAAEHGHAPCVKFLLESKAAIDAPRRDGSTPLHIACANSDHKVTRLLLRRRADPHAEWKGATPLHIAAANGSLGIAESLLRRKAVVNKRLPDGATPLYLGAENGHLGVVELLLSTNAKPNIKLKTLATPLFIAAQNGHVDVIAALLRTKPDINGRRRDGSTALYIACETGQSRAVEFLLSRDASVACALETGASPLYIASQNGHSRIVRMLIERKASVERAQGHSKVTPLVIASANGHHSVVRMLIQAGAQLETQQVDGATPLFVACEFGRGRVASRLIEAQADVNQPREDRTTPLFVATEHSHTTIVERLLRANARVEARRSDGATPLMAASSNGHEKLVKTLVAAAATVNAKAENGSTPLHEACLNGHRSVARYLVRNRALVSPKRVDGVTPLFLASQNGHAKIINMLIEMGAETAGEDRWWDAVDGTSISKTAAPADRDNTRSDVKRVGQDAKRTKAIYIGRYLQPAEFGYQPGLTDISVSRDEADQADDEDDLTGAGEEYSGLSPHASDEDISDDDKISVVDESPPNNDTGADERGQTRQYGKGEGSLDDAVAAESESRMPNRSIAVVRGPAEMRAGRISFGEIQLTPKHAADIAAAGATLGDASPNNPPQPRSGSTKKSKSRLSVAAFEGVNEPITEDEEGESAEKETKQDDITDVAPENDQDEGDTSTSPDQDGSSVTPDDAGHRESKHAVSRTAGAISKSGSVSSSHRRVGVRRRARATRPARGTFEDGPDGASTDDHGESPAPASDDATGDGKQGRHYTVQKNERLHDRYIVDTKIGHGAYATVVRAFDEKKEIWVAIKLSKNAPSFFRHAQEEAKIISELQQPELCPCIIGVLDVFVHDGHYCMVTDLLSQNLYELNLATDNTGVALSVVKLFGLQLLLALHRMAVRGALHRDIKPENVLMLNKTSSRIKLLDFGSACFQTPERAGSKPGRDKLETYVQSRFYRAPEVILGLRQTPAMDMWSLGCVLYELHAGIPLFQGQDEAHMLREHIATLGMPPQRMIVEGKFATNHFYQAQPAGQGETPWHLKGFQNLNPSSTSLGIRLQKYMEVNRGREGHNSSDYAAFVDVLAGMLRFDSKRRLSPSDALKHKFFIQSSYGQGDGLPPVWTNALREDDGDEDEENLTGDESEGPRIDDTVGSPSATTPGTKPTHTNTTATGSRLPGAERDAKLLGAGFFASPGESGTEEFESHRGDIVARGTGLAKEDEHSFWSSDDDDEDDDDIAFRKEDRVVSNSGPAK